uniref:Uncharacterized protein n=1 Tax=Neisseria meningitidis alpha153 TaxID=663926 RepID=C6S9Q6_NEIME|nr:hypothetical protein predicted by Glimmer/Critica [Neisseria meningitidis alpha153]
MPSERNHVSDGILSDGAQTESVYRQNLFLRIETALAPADSILGH